MKYQDITLGKKIRMSSAAVVIGALRVKPNAGKTASKFKHGLRENADKICHLIL